MTPRVEAKEEGETKPAKTSKKKTSTKPKETTEAAAQRKTKAIRAHVKSLPPAPKPPINSFIRFVTEYRQRHTGLPARDYFKRASEEWSTLSESDKDKYRATKEETEEYSTKLAEWKENLTGKDRRAVKALRKSRKRPSEYFRISSFSFFIMSHKGMQAEENHQRIASMAKRWNELPESEKQEWREKAKAEQDRRAAAYAEYLANKKKA